jgi:RNA polymerase sigma-70 factor (ECF subfamily)
VVRARRAGTGHDVVTSNDPEMDERTERFRRLFDACYRPLLAYARRRCLAPDADDLVADVLTVAWRRLDDVPAGAPLPWLFGVAHRTLANQRRGARRRLRLAERLRAEPPRTAADSVDGAGEEVRAALARLRPDDQEVLRLAAWEGLGPSEIAVVLGCSPNAAALRLSRARRRLRDALTGITTSRTGSAQEDIDG